MIEREIIIPLWRSRIRALALLVSSSTLSLLGLGVFVEAAGRAQDMERLGWAALGGLLIGLGLAAGLVECCPKCRNPRLLITGREAWCRAYLAGCGWTGYLVDDEASAPSR